MGKFSNLTELGQMFGVSSHDMGNWLVAIGLRTDDKKPSREAFAGGYVDQAPTNRGFGGYYWVWDRERTVAALEEKGYHRAGQSPIEKNPEPPTPNALASFRPLPLGSRASMASRFWAAMGPWRCGLWVRTTRGWLPTP